MPKKTQTDAFFMPVEDGYGGQRFCLFHPAQGGMPKGCVVYVHPFAEEMNKSRRMAVLQSRALAQNGFSVLQIDLLGCGDSSGDVGDATWQEWVNDVLRACTWMRRQSLAPLWLWGLRAGCLLVADAARQLKEPCNFLFWAPVASGKTQWQQFIRIKTASDMLGGNGKGVADGLRQQLAGGQPVEVAGYTVAPGLVTGLEQSTLAPPPHATPVAARAQRLEWFEMTTRDNATLSPVAQKAITYWAQAGLAVRSHVVPGPSFWQTTEIEDAPALVEATVAAIGSGQMAEAEAA